jgi:ATP-dependent DNA helicase RecG
MNNMENQVLEWKESWQDDYLKWICGFANANGGTLIIGKNDKGETVGVKEARKLLEDLPNKIRSTMGMIVDVDMLTENALNIIEIKVPAYPNAISYRGKYYLRSGSTNQELSGYALDALLLGKYGKTYDSMPLPNIKMADFWHDAFDIFRKKAIASRRLTAEDVAISDEELLRSLNLLENDYILLAAALVFYQSPQRYYVKIGYFVDETEILYQDELTGAIVGMADKVVETIFTKYFIGLIRYEGIQRIDDYPMPRAALREAVLNALVHTDYSAGSPVQIRIYDDKVTISNDCRLPEGTTIRELASAHRSVNINPLVSAVIFRSGQTEAWGRGIERIIRLCIEDNLPEPEFFITPRTFTITFHIRNNHRYVNDTTDLNGDVNDNTPENFGIKDGDGVNFGVKDGDDVNFGANFGIKDGIKDGDGVNFGANFGVKDGIKDGNGVKDGINFGIKDTVHDGIKDGDGVNFGVKDGIKDKDGINNIQIEIIYSIQKTPEITAESLSKILKINIRNIEKNLKLLKEKGYIQRVGARKNGYWKILKSFNS